MLKKIPAAERAHISHGWLNTYHLFSFADYWDPNNTHFGTLRVFNDDTIDAFSGFGDHGHDNMEIVTIIHSGALSHRDSIGNSATIKAGEVQRMTAGTGVIHAEKNLADEPVHLYQLWFLPSQQHLEPGYDQKDFSYVLDKNALGLVASDRPAGEAISLRAHASIFLSELEEGKTIMHQPQSGRGVFIYVRKGNIRVQDETLEAGDQARIENESSLTITAGANSHFILIEVAMDNE